MKRLLALFSVCIVGLSALTEAKARVYIDVTSQNIRKLNIAVPDFLRLLGPKDAHVSLNRQIYEVLAFDLGMSGYCNVQDKDTYIENLPALPGFRIRTWKIGG